MKSLNNTPWLNADGTRKSDEEIELLGRSWSPNIWNRYLESEVGNLEDESLVFYGDMDTEEILERADVLKFLQEKQFHENVENALLVALSKLSKTEREIIKEVFWNKLTDNEASKKLNKPHLTIRVLKSRAVKKLGKILASKSFKAELAQLEELNQLENIIYQRKQWINSDSLTFR